MAWALREGLAPAGVGLIIAGALTVFHLAGGDIQAALITAVSTALLVWRPNLPVVIVLGLGAVLMCGSYLLQ
ncbi:hypothetical protein [Taklimakanibacter deserti]|uniref:hypothetical protein n=1 Tax=Taklimakanibacter deserti TaxID=2267839 RepID=UPI000E658D4A